VTETDVKMMEKFGQSVEFYVFQEFYSPMHYYCRLKELGVSHYDSLTFTNIYANAVYSPLMRLLKQEYDKKHEGDKQCGT
jgi:hypothetical protein